MPLERRQLGLAGLDYLQAYLGVGVPLATIGLGHVASTPGAVTAALPSEADDHVASMFHSARALHPPYTNTPLDEWTATLTSPTYTAVASPKHLGSIDIATELMAATPSCFVCQNDVGVPSDCPGGAGNTVIGGAPALLVDGPSTPEQVAVLLDAAYVMGTFVGLVLGVSSQSLFANGIDACMARCQLIAIEAYDGEGLLFWRPDRGSV